MPLGVSYMGTKRALAHVVSEKIGRSRPGPLLDLFSGMCSVGQAVAPNRQVWNNDLQVFAHTVATAFFAGGANPPDRMDTVSAVLPIFRRHQFDLQEIFYKKIEIERGGLQSSDVNLLSGIEQSQDNIVQYPISHMLFTLSYGASYIGYEQAIEIDSIRKASDSLLETGHINVEQHRWLILALCRALSRCSTSTGHFAQPLSVNENNVRKYVAQRRRSIFKEWGDALTSMSAIGSPTWRKRNLAFNEDAKVVLTKLAKSRLKPSVIYADPPYTSDQYSRYYHLYETLVLYDNPGLSGKGRYRERRPSSQFCLKSDVQRSFLALIEGAANLGADIVISYPTNGLLHNSKNDIQEMLAAKYSHCEEPHEMQHSHSTMGGSKGVVRQDVTEVLYRAYMR